MRDFLKLTRAFTVIIFGDFEKLLKDYQWFIPYIENYEDGKELELEFIAEECDDKAIEICSHYYELLELCQRYNLAAHFIAGGEKINSVEHYNLTTSQQEEWDKIWKEWDKLVNCKLYSPIINRNEAYKYRNEMLDKLRDAAQYNKTSSEIFDFDWSKLRSFDI